MTSDVCAYILADHRENNGALPYMEAMVESNNKANDSRLQWKMGGGNIVFQKLNNAAIGDYQILLPSKNDSSKNIIAAVFERKTWKDLASSIKDQRHIHQHENMISLRDKSGCYIYYLIEGPLRYTDNTSINRIPFKNLHAKIRSMSLQNVHSFQTKDPQDTARLIINLTRDICRLYRHDKIHFLKQENIQQDISPIAILQQEISNALLKYQQSEPSETPITETIRHVIDMLSQPKTTTNTEGGIDVPEVLTTRPTRKNVDILLNMWCAIPKVSSLSAPILMENIELIDLIQTKPEDIESMTDKIAKIKYPSGASIGRSRAEIIMEVAYKGDDPVKRSRATDISAKILAEVPGVSLTIAHVILNQVPLSTICSGNMDHTQIANIERSNGRKLGNQMALKIKDIFT